MYLKGWEHMAALNPLGELVAGEAHHETAFERFKTRHNIRYESSTHEDFRKSVFKNNVRFRPYNCFLKVFVFAYSVM